MIIPRVIPTLLLRGSGLVKTTRFKDPVYLGDPINVVRIFNDKEVDELILLDIDATRERRGPNLRIVSEVASECFMPLGYGGGVRSLNDISSLLALGVEKVVLNSIAAEQPAFVRAAADRFGSSTIVISMDVKRLLLRGERVVSHGATRDSKYGPVEFARLMEKQGAGEIILTSVDREGTMSGYDLDLLRSVTAAVGIPVVAAGGARSIDDLVAAIADGGASAAAAGSMFVFQGPHRGVLISFPPRTELEGRFGGLDYIQRTR